MNSYYVAAFHSVYQALRFEKILQGRDIDVKMIPVPRMISSSCGIAARFGVHDSDTVRAMLLAGEADAHEVYLFTTVDKKSRAERVWMAAE